MRKSISYFRIITFSFLFLTQFITGAKAEKDTTGIKFRPYTFEQALAAAKAENKPIFLHGFADWCHYCMYMKETVYPDTEVGNFYNSKFICIKMDMEKEGKELAKTLKVGPFPLFVYFDVNGEVMHRAAGRRYKIPFLELGKEALDTNRQMRTYKRKYETGTATPFEVQYYFRMQEVAGMDAQLQIDDYLRKQPDSVFLNANSWKIMFEILKDPTLPVMKRILERKNDLELRYGADSVNHKLLMLNNTYLMSYVQQLDSAGYERAKQKILNTKGLDIAEKICAFADLNKLKMKSDWPAYKVEGRKFIEKYAMNDYRRLNEVAGVFHERFYTDIPLMETIEKWMERSVSLADLYKGNHLLMTVYVTLGKKDLALKTANHAIELAKRDNIDYKQTTQFLDVIQKMP